MFDEDYSTIVSTGSFSTKNIVSIKAFSNSIDNTSHHNHSTNDSDSDYKYVHLWFFANHSLSFNPRVAKIPFLDKFLFGRGENRKKE